MRTVFVYTLGALLFSSTLHAASIKVANNNIELSGGISGSFFMSQNNAAITSPNDILLSDALMELSSGELKKEGVGFTAAIGAFTSNTLYDGGIVGAYNGVNANSPVPFNYGWASVSPIENLVFDIGVLATTIGYESAMSYANGNILRGLMWNAQPAYYRGVRATYNIEDIGVFAEFNKDTSQGSSKSMALGAAGEINKINFSATYSYGDGGNDILDVVVGTEVMDIDVGANLDLFIIENPPTGVSSSAIGIGLYATPKLGKDYSFPIRLEFANNGDGPAYNLNTVSVGGNVFSVTVTPTMHFNKNGYVRAEVGYIKAADEIFTTSGNATKTNKPSVALQVGYMF